MLPAFPPTVNKSDFFQRPTPGWPVTGSFSWKPDRQQRHRRHVPGDAKQLFDLFLKAGLASGQYAAQPKSARGEKDVLDGGKDGGGRRRGTRVSLDAS